MAVPAEHLTLAEQFLDDLGALNESDIPGDVYQDAPSAGEAMEIDTPGLNGKVQSSAEEKTG